MKWQTICRHRNPAAMTVQAAGPAAHPEKPGRLSMSLSLIHIFLPGVAVAVTSDATTTKGIERVLRKYEIPVIARIHEDELLFSVRTVVDREMDDIAAALKEVE